MKNNLFIKVVKLVIFVAIAIVVIFSILAYQGFVENNPDWLLSAYVASTLSGIYVAYYYFKLRIVLEKLGYSENVGDLVRIKNKNSWFGHVISIRADVLLWNGYKALGAGEICDFIYVCSKEQLSHLISTLKINFEKGHYSARALKKIYIPVNLGNAEESLIKGLVMKRVSTFKVGEIIGEFNPSGKTLADGYIRKELVKFLSKNEDLFMDIHERFSDRSNYERQCIVNKLKQEVKEYQGRFSDR